MKVTVGTTAVRLSVASSATPILQNLGPGTVYMDTTNAVTGATGFRLPSGAAYEFPRDLSQSGSEVWLISDAAGTDVRYLVIG